MKPILLQLTFPEDWKGSLILCRASFKNAACNAKRGSTRPSKLSSQDKSRTTNELAREGSSCMQLKQLIADVTKSTILREIKSHNLLRHRQRNHALTMKSRHKVHRVQWAVERSMHYRMTRSHFFWREEIQLGLSWWYAVLFARSEIRNVELFCLARRRDSVLVCSAFHFQDTTQLTILDEEQTAEI